MPTPAHFPMTVIPLPGRREREEAPAKWEEGAEMWVSAKSGDGSDPAMEYQPLK